MLFSPNAMTVLPVVNARLMSSQPTGRTGEILASRKSQRAQRAVLRDKRWSLLLFELFQSVCCVLIFRIELKGFAVIGDGLLFLTIFGVGVGQAVIDVA